MTETEWGSHFPVSRSCCSEARLWGRGLRAVMCCLVVGLLLVPVGCRQPQVLNNDDAFRQLDALWTAISARRPEMIRQCRDGLTQLHRDQKLSDAGWKVVEGILTQAEQGDWTNAALRLKKLIRGQRRA